MKISFRDYFLEEFKHSDTSFRLYHDWVYDKVFTGLDIPSELAKIIKLTLYKVSYSSMFTSEMVRVDYQRTCEHRTKASSGQLKGKVISKLPQNDRTLIPALIGLTKSSNELIAKAASAKINQIKFYTDKV